MIGPRVLLAAVLTLALVVLGLGAGAPNPERVLSNDRLALERANEADAALVSLQEALASALESARDGAAAVVAGEDPPGPRFAEASAQLVASAHLADEAATAMARLEAGAPDADPIPDGVDGAELVAIAEQLDQVVEAADTFAEMRRRALNVPVALDAALAAVRDGNLDLAEEQLGIARADHAAVAEWDAGFVTLPVWVETADRSITIVETLVAALRAGDITAAEAAAAELAAFADEAAVADRALQIAISEGGGTMAAGPLAALSAMKRSVDDQRAAVGNLLAAMRSGAD
ncbi:MAG TPA: hypothetical protein VI277_08025 [Candidatus Limnocylindria bacterium]